MNKPVNKYQKDSEVIVLDDGKRHRPSQGRILHVINDDKIVVEFKPWSYSDNVFPNTLVFQKYIK